MRRTRPLLAFALLLALLAGCAAGGAPKTPAEPDAPAGQDGASVLVTLYEGNETADGLIASTAELSALTGAALTDALTAIGAIPAGTQCLQCSSGALEDGVVLLSLDLSVDFEEGIRAMGTAGETMILASLVNTFLEAFQADALALTIEGEPLETGHNCYDSPFSAYTFPQTEA